MIEIEKVAFSYISLFKWKKRQLIDENQERKIRNAKWWLKNKWSQNHVMQLRCYFLPNVSS
jgi:hypothetical protein